MCAPSAIRSLRLSNIVCKKCDIDRSTRAVELLTDEVNTSVAVVSDPMHFKIPSWMLNCRGGVKDGKSSQEYAPCRESLWEDLGPQRGRRQGEGDVRAHDHLQHRPQHFEHRLQELRH